MAGNGLSRRVDDLERGTIGLHAVTRWHWITAELGETQDDARARYERDVEPIGPTEGVIFSKVAAPPVHEAA